MRAQWVVVVAVVYQALLCPPIYGGDGTVTALSTGLVDPTLTDAVSVNPAGLALGSGGMERLSYTRMGSGEQDYAASVADSFGGFGLGATVNASNAGGFTLGSGVVGAAIGVGSLRVGVNATFAKATDITNTSSGVIGAGMLLGKENGFQMGVTLSTISHMTVDGILKVGAAYAKQKAFQVEVDVSEPLYTVAGPAYTYQAEAVKYLGKIGLGAFASMNSTLTFSQSSNVSEGVMASLRFTRSFGLDAHYSVGSEQFVSFGMSAGF